jgi:hypothetical protein
VHATALRAEDNGVQVSARDISAQRIGKLTFLREGPLLPLKDRLAVRALLTAAGVDAPSGEEAVAAAQYLQKLEDLAAQVGGSAPLPPPPSSQHVAALRAFKGNELLQQLLGNSARLKLDADNWRRLAQLKQQRLDQWERAQRLAAHASASGMAEDAVAELRVIGAERRLLVEPDPLVPLVARLVEELRGAVNTAHAAHEDAVGAAQAELASDVEWVALTGEERARIANRHRLDGAPAPDVATPEALLRTLDQQSLTSWSDRIAAVAARLQDARAEAVKLRAPKAVRVTAPHATFVKDGEINEYVEKLRELLKRAVAEHGSVII